MTSSKVIPSQVAQAFSSLADALRPLGAGALAGYLDGRAGHVFDPAPPDEDDDETSLAECAEYVEYAQGYALGIAHRNDMELEP